MNTDEANELPSLLKKYTRDVPEVALRNPKCPKKLLLKFSKETSPAVRCLVVENDNCPEKLIKRLLRDKDISVKVTAANRLLSLARGGFMKLDKADLVEISTTKTTNNFESFMLFRELKDEFLGEA